MDVATKGLTQEEAAYKLSIMEYPVSDTTIGPKAVKESSKVPSKKGDGMDEATEVQPTTNGTTVTEKLPT